MTMGADATISWPLSLKKFKNLSLISRDFIGVFFTVLPKLLKTKTFFYLCENWQGLSAHGPRKELCKNRTF